PAERVAATGAVPAAEAASLRDALGMLTDQGVRVVTTDAAAPAHADWPRPLARLASAPWAAPWDTSGAADPPDTYLLDLACARECAQADAVGVRTREDEVTPRLAPPPPRPTP